MPINYERIEYPAQKDGPMGIQKFGNFEKKKGFFLKNPKKAKKLSVKDTRNNVNTYQGQVQTFITLAIKSKLKFENLRVVFQL